MNVEEAYRPVPVTASQSLFTGAGNLAGFICTVGGTLTLRNTDSGGAEVVSDLPVLAGIYYPLPLTFGAGCYAELTSAQGTFCVTN